MRRRALIGTAWLMHTAAWLSPVIKGGITLPKGVPGWEAFRVGLAPIWPYQGVDYDAWYHALLPVLSSLSNLVMVSSPLVAWSHKLSRRRLWGVAALGAALIDSHWYFLNDLRADLRVGYFLWCGSFLLLAGGLLLRNGAE
jgi:hypothetical protein